MYARRGWVERRTIGYGLTLNPVDLRSSPRTQILLNEAVFMVLLRKLFGCAAETALHNGSKRSCGAMPLRSLNWSMTLHFIVWNCIEALPKMPSPVPFLRRIAFLEGISFLVLLCIAMPLKYLAHLPLAVLIAGSIHGVLFLIFCGALLRTMRLAKWPVSRCAVVFVAALLPCGPFVIDRRMAEWDRTPAA
jgi:integral membrane protein